MWRIISPERGDIVNGPRAGAVGRGETGRASGCEAPLPGCYGHTGRALGGGHCLLRWAWAVMALAGTLLHAEVDESLVGSPGFKPVREVLTLPWVGSIPTHLRHSRPAVGPLGRCRGEDLRQAGAFSLPQPCGRHCPSSRLAATPAGLPACRCIAPRNRHRSPHPGADRWPAPARHRAAPNPRA